ncbi:uncharacterized protein LOC112883167 [Panicum hallii]|nr:uncharacterized protein LOC112883167 [Panicum hallii]
MSPPPRREGDRDAAITCNCSKRRRLARGGSDGGDDGEDVRPWASLAQDLVELIAWRVLAGDLLDYKRPPPRRLLPRDQEHPPPARSQPCGSALPPATVDDIARRPRALPGPPQPRRVRAFLQPHHHQSQVRPRPPTALRRPRRPRFGRWSPAAAAAPGAWHHHLPPPPLHRRHRRVPTAVIPSAADGALPLHERGVQSQRAPALPLGTLCRRHRGCRRDHGITVVIAFGPRRRVAHATAGDQRWTLSARKLPFLLVPPISFQGKVYAMSSKSLGERNVRIRLIRLRRVQRVRTCYLICSQQRGLLSSAQWSQLWQQATW